MVELLPEQWRGRLQPFVFVGPAVFFANDLLALQGIERARERGLRIPQDLAVCGFDDLSVAASSGLTTVRQPIEEMGYRAGTMLLERLEEATPEVRQELLPVEVVVRAST